MISGRIEINQFAQKRLILEKEFGEVSYNVGVQMGKATYSYLLMGHSRKSYFFCCLT